MLSCILLRVVEYPYFQQCGQSGDFGTQNALSQGIKAVAIGKICYFEGQPPPPFFV
jgi:hypothetical protein